VKAASKVKARVADALLYRHWNAWDEGTRQHLFVVTLDNAGAVSAPRDLTPGARYDVPPARSAGARATPSRPTAASSRSRPRPSRARRRGPPT
jgi:hypothetical protein